VYNFDTFSNSSVNDLFIAFAAGIIFDLSAIVYTNLIYILLFIPCMFIKPNRIYDRFLEVLFLVINFTAFLFNIIDIEYFRFQKKRTGIELFSGENDIMKLLPTYLKDYWWLILITCMLTFLLYKAYRKTRYSISNERKPYISLKIISILIYLGVLTIAARGGLQTKPIQIISASQYGNTQNASLTLNTSFTIIQSFGKKTLENKQYFGEDELNRIISIDRNFRTDTLFNSKNVMIIILESFSNEYIGAINKQTKMSPFLDSLCANSYVFVNGFANGKKSNEAVPSIIAGIPSLLDESYSGSAYQYNEINTLPSLLKQKGYLSMFFHGGFNGSMNFDAFAKKANFDQYYGMDEYNNISDFDGSWGIYDEPFFKFTAQTLSSSPKPFFATLFSLSSHPPFSIPGKYEKEFAKYGSAKHKSFAYTDNALRRFFDYAKTKKWYYNTLFVILPDHTPDAEDKIYDTKVSYYSIPIIFHEPSRNWAGNSSKIISQIDLMPSILDYLHFDLPFKSFGNSVWQKDFPNYTINYRDGVYQIIDSTHVLQYTSEGVSALYNYKNDWFLEKDIKNIALDKTAEMKNKIEAYIQKYNATLIQNNYYYKP
jgi:phosphoglycerol transferase MdoB-like AlkP superfamily enzyme